MQMQNDAGRWVLALVPTPTGCGTWENSNLACEKPGKHRALPGDGRVWVRCRETSLMCCSSLAAKALSQAGTVLNGVGPRGWECFYAMDASSLLGWLCWDKEWKVTSSTVMREGSGRSCPNYWWLFSPFSFDAGVRGALRAYLPKKSEGGKNRSNNSIELFAGVV